MNEHIGEMAELYALGTLDENERAAVEAHIATCHDCLRRVGEAEETILTLEPKAPARAVTTIPLQLRRSRTAPWWLAVAAALVIGFLIPHPQNVHDDPQIAMLHSHFSHSQFQGNGPIAKVLYPRDRSWYYVIVEGSHRYRVVGANGLSAGPILGTTVPKGATSELFVRSQGRLTFIELQEGSTVLETAQIR